MKSIEEVLCCVYYTFLKVVDVNFSFEEMKLNEEKNKVDQTFK